MSFKLITSIMTGHKASKMIELLKEKKGIITADRSSARGTTIANQNGIEMETLTILVDENQADDIFEFVFFEADLNKPHQGIIYQQEITRASKYEVPKDIDSDKK